MSNLPAYRKTVTAVVGALITWGTYVTTSEPTAITASEWLLLAGGLATAAGVYQVTNEPDPDDPEAGESSIDLLIKIAALLLILAFAWAFFGGR